MGEGGEDQCTSVLRSQHSECDQAARVLHLESDGPLWRRALILALVKHLPATEIESIVGAIKDAPGGFPPL